MDDMQREFAANLTNMKDGRPWTLFTASFSHKDFMHMGGNMFAFWLFGYKTYRALGGKAFVGLYLAGGAACSLAHLIHNIYHGRTGKPLGQLEMEEISNYLDEIGRAVQQECRDRSRMPSSA
eukprot:TRINITY_DN87185_c0_g1_i1.p1 TRINITY_DN87185_c0_g1~~TRINITY_DN87185_c0_g1_i1.p1  ORF type:complete len:142 (+),score=18.96 TRINITY_DN87185_c0_g1_i1:61-426(+)